MNLIILPVKNESSTIEKTATELSSWCSSYFGEQYKILYIDDASTDSTLEKIVQLKDKKISIRKNQFDRGKGSTLKTGFIISSLIYELKPDDLIIFMDGDGQINPVEIKVFLNLMNIYNSDVVIGNKRHLFSITNYSFFRRIISNTYNLMIRILFGFEYRDTQCGIKIFRKETLDAVIDKVSCKQFAFDVELIVALREAGFRISDAPVKIKPQKNIGSVSKWNIFRTFIDTLIIWINKKRGFYK
jgi:glycosyltransferase involved in cell wall biosynthesis